MDAEGREVPTGEMGTLRIKRRLGGAVLLERARKIERDLCRRLVHDRRPVSHGLRGYDRYHGRTDDMLKVSGVSSLRPK